LTSAAVIDNRDLASTILGEIESAASCAGCDVCLFQLTLTFLQSFYVSFQASKKTPKKVPVFDQVSENM
jgi:hypothetical protein